LLKSLMTMTAGAAAALLTAFPTLAASPAYCAHYADQAVWQFHRNERIPGCFKGADARWNPDWRHHYDWCLGAPFETARAEDAYRGAVLVQCSMAAFGHP